MKIKQIWKIKIKKSIELELVNIINSSKTTCLFTERFIACSSEGK